MAPTLAQADDADLVQCLNAQTGGEQKQCTQALFQNAVNEMQKTYARVMEKATEADARNSGSGDGGAATAIAASQRAWEIYPRCRVQGRRRARRRIGQDGPGVRLSR